MNPKEIKKLGDVFKYLKNLDVKISRKTYLKLQKTIDSMNIEDECDLCGEKCDSHGYYTCNCYSPCCGAEMYPDSDICPECHEHCI